MVGSNGTLMTMRLVRSKLRKREESSSSVTVEAPTQIVPAVPEAPVTYRQNPSSVWVFPPLPPQPNLYCANSQVSLTLILCPILPLYLHLPVCKIRIVKDGKFAKYKFSLILLELPPTGFKRTPISYFTRDRV